MWYPSNEVPLGCISNIFELLLVGGCMKYCITVTWGGQSGHDGFDVAHGDRLLWHELRRFFSLPKSIPSVDECES